MNRMAKLLMALALTVFSVADLSLSVEFIIPRALGPVISRADSLIQYEYYVDKGGEVKTFVAFFDGKGTVRLSPESTQELARETERAISGREQARTFTFDKGRAAYLVDGDKRSLVISPEGGTPVTLADEDIDGFVKNCRDASTVATTWVADALKLRPAGSGPSQGAVAAGQLSPWVPGEPMPAQAPVTDRELSLASTPAAGAAEPPAPPFQSVAEWIPDSVKEYVPPTVVEYADKAKAEIERLYRREKWLTTICGALALLALLFFWGWRRNRRNALRLHEYGQQQIREAEKRRREEITAASSQVTDMSRQLEGIQKGHEEAMNRLREENKDNSVIFANTITELVKGRDSIAANVGDYVDELAKKYGATEPGKILQQARNKSRALVSGGQSAVCHDQNERYRKTAASFITDVFDMKADQAAALVNNGRFNDGMTFLGEAGKQLNAYGRSLFHTELSDDYLRAREDELKALAAAREAGVEPTA